VSTGGNTWTNNISINNGGFSTLTGSTIGIGSTTPGYSLDVAGIVQGQTTFQSNTNANNVGLGPLQQVYLGQYGAAAPRGTCVRWGDSVGAAYYVTTGGTNLSFYKDVRGGNAALAFQLVGTSLTNANPNVYIPNSLGIGTMSPNYTLDINGGIHWSYCYSDGGGFFPNVDGATNSSNLLGSSARRWYQVWSANGTIQTSDSSLKESTPLPYGLAEVLQMNTILYQWKNQAELPDTDPSKNFKYYGFCADELRPLLPELVYDEDTNAPVQMNYSEILPVVVNAVKELAEQNKTLQSQLTSVLSRLAAAGL